MKMYSLVRNQTVPADLETVFRFFEKPENLSKITPPALRFRLLTASPILMDKGTVIDYTIRIFGSEVFWKTLITLYEPPLRFVDEQIAGPYRLWRHTHTFRETKDGTEINDDVSYALPLGFIGDLVHRFSVRHRLSHIFDFRAGAIERLFSRKAGDSGE